MKCQTLFSDYDDDDLLFDDDLVFLCFFQQHLSHY